MYLLKTCARVSPMFGPPPLGVSGSLQRLIDLDRCIAAFFALVPLVLIPSKSHIALPPPRAPPPPPPPSPCPRALDLPLPLFMFMLLLRLLLLRLLLL